jgi:hypothetical protein
MAKNLTFQHLHFNKKVNIVNSIYSKLTITIHSLLFKQLYFISSPFSFFCFLSHFFDDCSRSPFCFFSSFSTFFLTAGNAGKHHCTTALHDARNDAINADRRAPLHYTAETPASTTTLHDARNVGEHHTLSSMSASTGGRREDVPPVLQHPIDEALQNKVKKEREK